MLECTNFQSHSETPGKRGEKETAITSRWNGQGGHNRFNPRPHTLISHPHYCRGLSGLEDCAGVPQHQQLSATHQAWHLYDMSAVSLQAQLFPLTLDTLRWPARYRVKTGITELMRSSDSGVLLENNTVACFILDHSGNEGFTCLINSVTYYCLVSSQISFSKMFYLFFL